MTFIDIFADAYDHFDRVGKSDEMAILVRYAKEELHLSDTDIPSFLMRADFTTITKENYKTTGDFYAWYYVNYVSEIKRSLSFDIHIVGNPHEDFSLVGIQPQRMDASSGQPHPKPCRSADAEFQAVYIETVTGEKVYIGRCRTHQVAVGLCALLKAFAFRWLK